MKTYKWTLKDIIMIGIISVIFAVFYLGAVYAIEPLKIILTPFGLGLFAQEVIFGVWFTAATFAPYVIRKPGVAIVAEMLSAFLEVIMGNFYGPIVFVSGFVQGIGAEFAFYSTRYKRYDFKVMTLAAFGATFTSFIWGFLRSGFFSLDVMTLIAIFIVRFISAFVFSTIGSKVLADGLAKAGVLKGYAIAENYEESLEVYDVIDEIDETDETEIIEDDVKNEN